MTNESERLTGRSTHVQGMEHLHTWSLDSWVVPFETGSVQVSLTSRGMVEHYSPTPVKLACIPDYRHRCPPVEAPRGGGGLVPMATMGEAHSCTGRTFGTMELSNTQNWLLVR